MNMNLNTSLQGPLVAPCEVEVRQIPKDLNELERVVHDLEVYIEKLRIQLDSILVPEPAMPSSTSKPSTQPEPIPSKLSGRIQDLTERMLVMIAAVGSMRERVQV
jgi:hypothetical protein